MESRGFSHFVFIDFENVPAVDLGAVEDRDAHVTLLIGKNQKKLDLNLVRLIHRLATQVELVEVGASGRNALDITLAYYLGRAVQRAPDAQFCIVSRDKDYGPMIEHLHAANIKVTRFGDFDLLPFARRIPAGAPARTVAAAKTAGLPKVSGRTKQDIADDRFDRLVRSLKGRPQNRPKKRATLLRLIGTFHANKLSPAELNAVVDQLIKHRILAIDERDKVSYP